MSEGVWTRQGVAHWIRVLALYERNQLILIREVVVRMNSERDPNAPPQPWPDDSDVAMMFNPHVISLALTHMKNRLKWLQGRGTIPDQAKSAVTRFLKLYDEQKLDELRHSLEHSDAYVVGKGDKPELVVTPTQNQTPGCRFEKHALVEIDLLGSKYAMRDVVDAAYALYPLVEPLAGAYPLLTTRSETQSSLQPPPGEGPPTPTTSESERN